MNRICKSATAKLTKSVQEYCAVTSTQTKLRHRSLHWHYILKWKSTVLYWSFTLLTEHITIQMVDLIKNKNWLSAKQHLYSAPLQHEKRDLTTFRAVLSASLVYKDGLLFTNNPHSRVKPWVKLVWGSNTSQYSALDSLSRNLGAKYRILNEDDRSRVGKTYRSLSSFRAANKAPRRDTNSVSLTSSIVEGIICGIPIASCSGKLLRPPTQSIIPEVTRSVWDAWNCIVTKVSPRQTRTFQLRNSSQATRGTQPKACAKLKTIWWLRHHNAV